MISKFFLLQQKVARLYNSSPVVLSSSSFRQVYFLLGLEEVEARGKSLQRLAYEIYHFSKGFLAYAYEIYDFKDFQRFLQSDLPLGLTLYRIHGFFPVSGKTKLFRYPYSKLVYFYNLCFNFLYLVGPFEAVTFWC